jgi:hypothetical protein
MKSSLISRTIKNHAPKLAPLLAITNYQSLTRLPKRHRVGPSASLDECIRKLFAIYNMAKRECQFNI